MLEILLYFIFICFGLLIECCNYTVIKAFNKTFTINVVLPGFGEGAGLRRKLNTL